MSLLKIHNACYYNVIDIIPDITVSLNVTGAHISRTIDKQSPNQTLALS